MPAKLMASAVFVALVSAAAPAPGCDLPQFLGQCRNASQGGVVDVDLRYDVGVPGGTTYSPDGVLNADEIQCAIDCMDGDLEPEFVPDLVTSPPYRSPADACVPWPCPIEYPCPTPDYPCRPAAGAGCGALPQPNCFKGGVVRFRAGLTYLVDKPLHLPFGGRGQVVVRGEGATLVAQPRFGTFPGAYAVIQRGAPSRRDAGGHILRANEADLEVMASADGYIIEGLNFELHPGWPRDVPLKAIEFFGSQYLTIRDCTVSGGFDIGIEQRGGQQTLIERCTFRDDHALDIGLMNAWNCLENRAAVFYGLGYVLWNEPCFDPAVDTGANVFEGGRKTVAQSGSNKTIVRDTLHIMSDPAVTGILVRDSDSVVIDGASFVASKRPWRCVWLNNSFSYVTTLRHLHFDVPAAANDVETLKRPLIYNPAGGMALMNGIEFTGQSIHSGQDLLYDLSGSPTAGRMILMNGRLPDGMLLRRERPIPGGVDRSMDLFLFVGVEGKPPVTSHERWAGMPPEGDWPNCVGTITAINADEYHLPNSRICSFIPAAHGQWWSTGCAPTTHPIACCDDGGDAQELQSW
jgi:hypothetical protein